MDDTSAATPPPSDPRPRDLPRRRSRLRPLAIGAGIAAASLVAVAACSSGSSDSGSSAPVPKTMAAQDSLHGRTSALDYAAAPDLANSAPSAKGPSQTAGQAATDVLLAGLGRSQIKTAQIGIRSKAITTVVSGVEGVAGSQGGFIASENTVTNIHGVATSSSITIRVPVETFDGAVAAVSKLGQVSDRRVSTQDVTGRVADVSSRVTSAKDAITQLRLLFSHATRLSDIITLESQLQDRQADLESLLAQQRALTNETTLSTISVQVTRPPTPNAVVVPHKSSTTGFVGGIKEGWDALSATFVAVSHGLGAALPLGLCFLVIAALVWAAVRRMPRHHVETSE